MRSSGVSSTAAPVGNRMLWSVASTKARQPRTNGPIGPQTRAAPMPSGATIAPASTVMRASRALAATSATGESSATGSSALRPIPCARDSTNRLNARGNNHSESACQTSSAAATARPAAATTSAVWPGPWRSSNVPSSGPITANGRTVSSR